MARHLRRNGWCVGRHRVRRLMSRVGSRRSTSGLRPASRIPAQDLSVPAASPDDRSAELRVVRRHHLYPDAPRLPLSGGDYGLGEPQGPGLAVIEHDGRRILCRGTGRSDCPAWPARHLQHRSGLAVHQLRLHNHAEGCWHPRLDGWSWPLDGQRIHRATVAIAEIRACSSMPSRPAARHSPVSTVGSDITTQIDHTRRSPAGRPMRSMLPKQTRRNWRRNQTQNLP